LRLVGQCEQSFVDSYSTTAVFIYTVYSLDIQTDQLCAANEVMPKTDVGWRGPGKYVMDLSENCPF